MSNANMDGLPPEMQARIAQIIEGAKAKQAAQSPALPAEQPQAAPPPARQPNLMDHVIMLRNEVDALRQELHAVAQVVDACGQAVGQMYSMFQSQTTPTSEGAAYQAPLEYQQQVDTDF